MIHLPMNTHVHSYSHDTHSCEVSVLKELLSLHSLSDSHNSLLQTARISTQLSTLCRACHTHAICDHTPCEAPLTLLDEAVALLEPLVTSLTPSHTHTLTQAHQHLAMAYLWKALCTLEQNIRYILIQFIYMCKYNTIIVGNFQGVTIFTVFGDDQLTAKIKCVHSILQLSKC